MLKDALKSVLPESILRLQDNVRGMYALKRAKTNTFNSFNLRLVKDIDLTKFKRNPTVNESWSQDRNTIGSIFGSGEYNLAVSPQCRQVIYNLIINLRPNSVLEIGTNVGGSTLYIGSALKRLGEGGTITTVDIVDVNDQQSGPWVDFGLKHSPQTFASQLGLDNIEFHISDSLIYMESVDTTYDLIFLDGDHAPAVVYNEVCAALRILNKDGVILLHDYYPFGKRLRPERPPIIGPFTAVERIRRENPDISVLPLSPLLDNGDNRNFTSLAVLGRGSLPQ